MFQKQLEALLRNDANDSHGVVMIKAAALGAANGAIIGLSIIGAITVVAHLLGADEA